METERIWYGDGWGWITEGTGVGGDGCKGCGNGQGWDRNPVPVHASSLRSNTSPQQIHSVSTNPPQNEVHAMEFERYHAYRRWTPSLPLASAAPRCTPRRAKAADDVTMETYYYGCQSGRRSKYSCSAKNLTVKEL